MAILNVTPDSFSDGNLYLDPSKALDRALILQAQGADILDVGAESTRPGATPVSEQEELRRLLPVIQKLIENTEIPVSVDTYKPNVARECLRLGVSIINDVTGLENAEMRQIAAEFQCPVVIMHKHSLGTPVKAYFERQISLAKADGITKVILDPGFGFSKTPEQNWLLLNTIKQWRVAAYPVLIGTSKKTFHDGNKKYLTKDSVRIGRENGADIIRIHEITSELRTKS